MRIAKYGGILSCPEIQIMVILTMFKQLLYDLPQHLKNELDHQLHDKIKLALKKMNLVNREEFDIQTEVLKKTRLKLEALEQKLAHLETKDA